MSNLQSRILKDKIDVYAESETFDDQHQAVKTYAFSFSDRAETTFAGGTEKLLGQMSYADKVIRFKVRFHLTRYNERQFILWRGDYYNIRSIDPDRDRKYMVITGDRAPEGTIVISE